MTISASPLVITLISAASALVGVLLKIGYDFTVELLRRRHERGEKLLAERKQAFDEFLACHRKTVEYREQLHALSLKAVNGETVPDGTLENFPDSPFKELISRLEAIRCLAQTYAVIQAAEAIIRLYSDMSVAERQALDHPSKEDEIVWFVLCRFMEDREREFVHAYRKELGLGMPRGAPSNYLKPIHPALDQAERTLRLYLPKQIKRTGKEVGSSGNKTCQEEQKKE